MNSLRVLVLYSEIGPYNIPFFRALVARYGAEITVVAWDKKRLKPYVPPAVERVVYHKRSEHTAGSICELAKQFQPQIVYASGWMDRGYFKAMRWARKSGIPVVVGFDDQWTGSLRQWCGTLVFKSYLSRFISHAWICGVRQYEYARRFGFKRDRIVFDMLTCDSDLFSRAAEFLPRKRISFPRSFLYVGNFRWVKGTDILLDAYRIFREKYDGTWQLHCVGNGEYEHLVKAAPGVRMSPFTDQSALLELCRDGGVFILPSRHDQWGVVVHEFACAGLPLLLSTGVGAKDTFLIEGFNGFSFESKSPDDLARKMAAFSALSDSALAEMAENSTVLAGRVSPETSAANFASVLGPLTR